MTPARTGLREGVRAATEETWMAECQGRPPVQVLGTRGMVSSMHPTASQIGADILKAGGNAVDAGVAVGAAISVLSPDWAGPAGDSAWLLYLRDSGTYRYLDGYTTCPAAISPERIAAHFDLDQRTDRRAYEEEPPEQRHVGMITGMVPGTPAAWCELAQRHGTMPLPALVEPAIDLAERGFPVNRYLAVAVKANRAKLHRFSSSRAVWFDAGGTEVGEAAVLRQPELADTLRRLAAGGQDGFYKGETAAAIVEHAQRQGGVVTLEDLGAYRAVWREVLRGTYRGRDIVVTSPPTAGVHVLQALNILEGYPFAELPFHGTQSVHLMIEALKLALADRRAVGGDPDFLPMNTASLADKVYAAELRSRIDEKRATPRGTAQFAAPSTTHFAVVDGKGNMVSATQTLGSRFGCGDTVPGTGLLMNDRTWWMFLGPGANQVAPGHRANIGHAATMVAEGGVPVATLGSPGGFGIVQYMVQVVSHMIDSGLDIQRAIEAPRFKIEHLRGRVGFERRFDAAMRSALADMGHEVFEFPEWSDRVGGVEGVSVDPATGVMLGGYDPRRNSLAVGL